MFAFALRMTKIILLTVYPTPSASTIRFVIQKRSRLSTQYFLWSHTPKLCNKILPNVFPTHFPISAHLRLEIADLKERVVFETCILPLLNVFIRSEKIILVAGMEIDNKHVEPRYSWGAPQKPCQHGINTGILV